MGKKYDIVVTIKDERSDKPRYQNIGAVFETSKGLAIKIEAIPVGWNGWANLYEPKPREQRPAQQQPELDDDRPF